MKECISIKYLALLLCTSSVLFPVRGYSQFTPSSAYLNPGIQLGYRFGEKGGFVLGFEISETRWNGPVFYGLAVSIDYCNEVFMIHLAPDAGTYVVCMSMGPIAAIRSNQSVNFGLDVTFNTGVVILPYYRYMSFLGQPDQGEVGAFLKLPILTFRKDPG